MSRASDGKTLIRKYFDAYAASDWKAYEQILDRDVEYEDSGGSKLRGARELMASINDWKAGFPDARVFKIRSMVAEGGTVVAEITWTGTHTNTLTSKKTQNTISQDVAPTGNVIFHDAVLIMDFSDSKITNIRHYYDMNDFTLQISGAKTKAS